MGGDDLINQKDGGNKFNLFLSSIRIIKVSTAYIIMVRALTVHVRLGGLDLGTSWLREVIGERPLNFRYKGSPRGSYGPN